MMQSNLPAFEQADIRGKTILLLADTDVPLSENLTIEDDTRLAASLPTLEYLFKQGARVILIGKLGRPHGEVKKELSLEPVARWFAKKFNVHSSSLVVRETNIGEFNGWEVVPSFFILENIRFHKEEEANDNEFAKRLASLADIYVNDAFALSHRNHASVASVPKLLPHYAGIHLQKEIEVLGGVLDNPKRPLVVIIGGAKLETKLPLVEKMHHFADFVLVGGKIAKETKTLIKEQHVQITERKSVLLIAEEVADGTDITAQSAENFIQIINSAQTIVWNGPMGLIDPDPKDTEKATRQIARAIAKSSGYKIIGGGDTLGYIKTLGLLDSFDFVSTGGGAMLAFLSGEKLPGLEALLK